MQILNENRRSLGERPDPDDEQAVEAYNAKMRALVSTPDQMEAQEAKYAALQLEGVQLEGEMAQQEERKKNMQLINDQVGGWTTRVVVKMQEQLGGLTIQTENRSLVDVLREIQ